MKLHDSVNMHKRKIIFDWRHYRIFYTSVMSLFIFKHACADNYLKSFHSIAMKLHDSSNWQFMKDQIRLVFLCHFFFASNMPLFHLLPRQATHRTRRVLDYYLFSSKNPA